MLFQKLESWHVWMMLIKIMTMITTKDKKGNTPNDSNRLDAEIVVPWKYLSNPSRFLNLLLINYEIELNLSWKK